MESEVKKISPSGFAIIGPEGSTNFTIIKSRAGTEVGELLRNCLIDVCLSWAQFVPPDRKRDSNARFDSITYPGFHRALASVIPDANLIAI